MLKKTLSFILVVSIFAITSSVGVSAQTNFPAENHTATLADRKPKRDLKASIAAVQDSSKPTVSSKTMLADYEKSNQSRKGFSTTTKVLIVVGIAAAVAGIVIFAASRDKIKTF